VRCKGSGWHLCSAWRYNNGAAIKWRVCKNTAVLYLELAAFFSCGQQRQAPWTAHIKELNWSSSLNQILVV
jgi:hypothetical protein